MSTKEGSLTRALLFCAKSTYTIMTIKRRIMVYKEDITMIKLLLTGLTVFLAINVYVVDTLDDELRKIQARKERERRRV